jgi:solute carrier family 25 S-adenosylmethionine transporter 26
MTLPAGSLRLLVALIIGVISMPICEGVAVSASLPTPTIRNKRALPLAAVVPSANKKNENTIDKDSNAISVSQRLLAGGASRAVAQLLLYPVDALRTLAQTRDHRTLADVGAAALFRGCTMTSSFALFMGAIQFGIFGATREACGPVLASALGAAGSCVVSVPQEVIKQRLVTGVYSSFRNACVTIYRNEGVRGFYSAWRPTMARNVPFVVACFTTNDMLTRKILNKRKNMGAESEFSSALSVSESALVGIASALVGAAITHPADVIKTRMMTQGASAAIPYLSTMDCVQTILKTEGIASLYSGFVQRSLYMGPLWAIQFALNGRVMQLLEERNNSIVMAKGPLTTRA